MGISTSYVALVHRAVLADIYTAITGHPLRATQRRRGARGRKQALKQTMRPISSKG